MLNEFAACQDLRDMHGSQRFLFATNEAFEVHQTGHVARGDDLGTGLFVIGDAIVAHHAGDGFFADRESSTESATIIGPLQGNELNAFDFLKQAAGEVEVGNHAFRRATQAKFSQSVTTVVQADTMRKLDAFEFFDFEDVG